MKYTEYEGLKVGTYCMISRGYDAGRLCVVLYIKDESILVCTADGSSFKSKARYGLHGRLRIMNYRELTLIGNENLEEL